MVYVNESLEYNQYERFRLQSIDNKLSQDFFPVQKLKKFSENDKRHFDKEDLS